MRATAKRCCWPRRSQSYVVRGRRAGRGRTLLDEAPPPEPVVIEVVQLPRQRPPLGVAHGRAHRRAKVAHPARALVVALPDEAREAARDAGRDECACGATRRAKHTRTSSVLAGENPFERFVTTVQCKKLQALSTTFQACCAQPGADADGESIWPRGLPSAIWSSGQGAVRELHASNALLITQICHAAQSKPRTHQRCPAIF
jgi:hypothetical protein